MASHSELGGGDEVVDADDTRHGGVVVANYDGVALAAAKLHGLGGIRTVAHDVAKAHYLLRALRPRIVERGSHRRRIGMHI